MVRRGITRIISEHEIVVFKLVLVWYSIKTCIYTFKRLIARITFFRMINM